MAHSSAQRARTRRPIATFGSRTDIGCLRDHNEDSLIVTPPLFVVADGMGGHAAGEVASEIAVTTMAEKAPRHADVEALGKAVEAANRAVILAAGQSKEREGMGTTVTSAILEGERLVIAQVGDSRAYLLHQGKLQQLTRDHSLMADMIDAGQLTAEEARVHPNRSVITRALGSDPRMVADLYEINVEAGDRLLLCSDGLSAMLEDDQIEAVTARTRDPQRCASSLVNEAIAAGGHDNITVIIVDVTGHSEKRRRRYTRKSRRRMVFIALVLVGLLAATGIGLYAYAANSAYLIAENGTVSVYRGVPGELFGTPLSQLDSATDIKVEKLQPGAANRLQGGIRVDNLEAAHKLIAEYRSEIDRAAGNTPTGEAAVEGAGAPDTTGTPAVPAPAPKTEG
ncbi:MAG: Stp1/IreP family PP2C-type Ser/Thr phosphatase [Raoultibacter sp.]